MTADEADEAAKKDAVARMTASALKLEEHVPGRAALLALAALEAAYLINVAEQMATSRTPETRATERVQIAHLILSCSKRSVP